MANINDIMLQASELQPGISRLLRNSTYPRYDDLSGLEINYEDGEQLFLLDELRGIMEKLADVEDCIRYIAQPVLKMEQLRKNASGRYETGSGFYYCCGSPIEALVTDEYHDVPYWTRTTVEHNGEDYYLVGYKGLPMEGLRVRVRSAA